MFEQENSNFKPHTIFLVRRSKRKKGKKDTSYTLLVTTATTTLCQQVCVCWNRFSSFPFFFFLFNSNAFLVGHLEYERIVGMVVMVDATLSGARA